jgi:hypothetical protein
MKPEKQQLIHEVLEGESHSEYTLLTAAKTLRRRRQWRVARQTFTLITFLIITVCLVERENLPRMALHVLPPETKLQTPTHTHSLTDEELLALFPNTPVALATLPNGKKLLIFPRHADQAKYIRRL